jgi:microsomal dipeptidase-like Zn-dependent dipeptidase
VPLSGWQVAAGAGGVAAAFFGLAARVVGSRLNRLAPEVERRPVVPPRARALHDSLRIVDLHDDLLLWDRDPLRRSGAGHSDVPRLAEGNVAVEVFSTVTQVPRASNYLRNDGRSDILPWLAVASRWPPRAWTSRLARAVVQGEKLVEAAGRSAGRLRVATTREELAGALELRAAQPPGGRSVIGLLSTEGLHALEGRTASLDVLFAHGFRCAGLTHLADNGVAGSAHGARQDGLSEHGREVVARMEALGMIVDAAHASARALDDLLAGARRPFLVSHAGVQGVFAGPRNLSDEQLRRIASRGGLVGIGFWREASGDVSPAGVARSIAHAVDVAGVEHVALGSDWDGAVTVGFEASALAALTAALLDQGMAEGQIRRVMGENALRFLLAALP